MKKVLFIPLFCLFLTSCSVPDALPEGSVYYTALKENTLGNYDGATECDTFPALSDGDAFVYNGYEYRYNREYKIPHGTADAPCWIEKELGGWGVRVIDADREQYPDMLDEINSVPVVSLAYTFDSCEKLIEAPRLSKNATCLYWTFGKCTSLEKAVLPNGAKDLRDTFFECTSLKISPHIPEGAENMYYTFYGARALEIAPKLSDSVTVLDGTFIGCVSLKSYEGSEDSEGDFSAYRLPSGISTLIATFSGCENMLHAPEIPESVFDMTSAFRACTKLVIPPTLHEGLQILDFCFYDCPNVEKITLPDSVVRAYKVYG